MLRLASLLALTCLCPMSHAADPSVTSGDYTASFSADGLQVSFGGVPMVSGSRLTIHKPGYTGAVGSGLDFSPEQRASGRVEGSRLRLEGALPELEGHVVHEVLVEETGVTITLRLSMAAQAEAYPIEYTGAVFPAELLAGGGFAPHGFLGEREPQAISVAPPEETGPGTKLLSGSVRGLRLVGEGLQITAECLGASAANFYDMRSRDYAAGHKAFWLLYQWSMSRGETTIQTRLSAQALAPAAEGSGEPQGGRSKMLLEQGTEVQELTTICLPAGAHPIEAAAAGELQTYLTRMTGGPLELVTAGEQELPERGVIYVGAVREARRHRLYRTREVKAMGPDDLLVRARDGNALLVGGGYRGTTYAVYRFLQHLGCRFYATDLEVVPPPGEVRLQAPLEITDSPAFEWRAMWGTVAPMKVGLSPGEWTARVGEVDVPKMMAIPPGGFWHHTMGFLVRAEDHFDSHPEYFAELGGERKRVDPAVQQHCLSNPELRWLMTDKVLEWIAAHPDQDYYPVHFGDVAHFCECSECRKLYEQQGSISDTVIWFLNEIAAEVAEKHPDKFLTILSYHATRKAPVKVRPLPNLLIVFCAIVECQGRPWSHPVNLRFNVLRDLEDWVRIHPLGGRGIMTFDYPMSYHYTGFPYPALYAYVENLRAYSRLDLRGTYVCGLSERSHLVHLYSYVIPRIMWNPDRDLGTLIEEFCRAWYGPAWEPMRDYVDLIHGGAMASQSPGVMDCHAGPGQAYFKDLFSADLCERAYALFSRAESLADDDLIRRRIAHEKWGLLFIDQYLHGSPSRELVPDESAEGYRLVAPSEEAVERLGEFLRTTKLVGRAWEMEPRFGFSLSNVVGMEPSVSPWWDCPQMKALMDDPRGALGDEQTDAEAAARLLPSLSNEHLRITLVPTLGGRIWRLYSRDWEQEVLWRAALPWTAVQSGVGRAAYRNFGGYEEYGGPKWPDPGWSERYDCTVAPDGLSATLTADLPGDLRLQRRVTLAPDRPAVEIVSRLENTGQETRNGAVLRGHPQFAFASGSPRLSLRLRQADGTWETAPLASETEYAGERLPAGAWGVVDEDTGRSVTLEFDPAQVRACYLFVDSRSGFYNLELFSRPTDLAPGDALELRQTLILGDR